VTAKGLAHVCDDPVCSDCICKSLPGQVDKSASDWMQFCASYFFCRVPGWTNSLKVCIQSSDMMLKHGDVHPCTFTSNPWNHPVIPHSHVHWNHSGSSTQETSPVRRSMPHLHARDCHQLSVLAVGRGNTSTHDRKPGRRKSATRAGWQNLV